MSENNFVVSRGRPLKKCGEIARKQEMGKLKHALPMVGHALACPFLHGFRRSRLVW